MSPSSHGNCGQRVGLGCPAAGWKPHPPAEGRREAASLKERNRLECGCSILVVIKTVVQI